MNHTNPGTSMFTYTVVGFVLLMVLVKLLSAMRDEQKEGTRFRNRFVKPDAPRKPYADDGVKPEVGDDSSVPPKNKP